MKSKRSIKIISIVLIFVLICISITYVKSGNKEVLATTKEFNLENLQDNEHMYVEVDSSGDKIPVPNGYVGSKATGENEIDTGYVIYEGTEEVNDSNVKEAKKQETNMCGYQCQIQVKCMEQMPMERNGENYILLQLL